MNPKSSNVEIDVQAFQASMQDIVRRIREEGDPNELNFYKKLFKKSVPLFMRSYVAAYLAKGLQARGGVRRKFVPATLFISIGKNRKVFPRDLVQLIASAGKIQKTDIGDIKILDNYAFVEVDEKLAQSVISLMDGITYRGRRLTVNFAKKKGEDGAPPSREPRTREKEPEIAEEEEEEFFDDDESSDPELEQEDQESEVR